MTILLLSLSAFGLYLAKTFNEQYVTAFILFLFPFYATYIALKFKYRKNLLFHPVFLFNAIYLIVYASTDIANIYYDPDLVAIVIGAYYTFNFGAIIFIILSKKKKETPSIQLSSKSKNLYMFLSFSVAIISFIIYFYLYGIPVLSSNINLARTIQNKGTISPIFQLAIYNANIASFIFGTYLIKKYILNISLKIKTINYILGALYLVLLLMMGNRTSFIFILLPILIFFILFQRKITLKTVFILGGLTIILAVSGTLRNQGDFNIGKDLLNSIFNELRALKFNFYHVYTYSTHSKLTHGVMQLRGFAILLPGHQLDTSLFLKKELGLSFIGGGIPPTIVGQLLIDFGIYGMFLEMFFLGILLQIYFVSVIKSTKEYRWLFFCWATIYFLYMIRNGVLYSYTILLAFIFLFNYRVNIQENVTSRYKFMQENHK